MRALRLFFAAFVLFFASSIASAEPDPPADNKKDPPAESDATKLAAALARQRELEEQIEGLRSKKKKSKKEIDEDDDEEEDDEDEEESLGAKARKQRAEAEKTAATTKEIERALGFNLSVDDFIVKNSTLLPAEIVSIVKIAHKETYDNALAKASALKAEIIKSYFSVQANLDALTVGQRTTLDDYLKLTKTGKESKAAEIYENIFEPALETIRKIKKAEEVGRGRSGYANTSDAESAYKDKLVAMSRKTHLGEKGA